jgi:alpha-galactosidase
VLVRFYETIRAAAGDAVILGCNTVGHLSAGLVDISRTGDDTSGRGWERTRRMGVNTLAFRLAQHRRFFTVDADCVPCTPQTPWERNREFAELIALSGTALFVSIDPEARTAQTDADLRAAFALSAAAADEDPGAALRPVDWLATTTPRRWIADGAERTYDWTSPWGALDPTGD